LEKFQDDKKIDKVSLLADEDEDNKNSKLDIPLWLVVTAKQHIATSHSLKPGKVTVPHPLYSSPQTQICLITADPPAGNPTAYKDLVKHKAFPNDLQPKIAKVIRFSKLSKKYKSYESRRQLFAEYDVFLADERIVHLVPAALGSVFYKSTTKRPIPVSLIGKTRWGKREKKDALARLKPKKKNSAENGPESIGAPEDVGVDIEKALRTLAVHLSPSPTMSIKIAYAGWPAEWISENVDEVVQRVVSKYIPNQWRGVKAIHLKGPETAALPIWMAEELWQDVEDVLDEGEKAVGLKVAKKDKAEKKEQRENRKKRKLARLGDGAPIEDEPENATIAQDLKKKKRKSADTGEEREIKRTKKLTKEVPQEETKDGSTKRKEKLKKLKEASRSDAAANAEALRVSNEDST
jgi:ribosome biogenesis protein UTP30